MIRDAIRGTDPVSHRIKELHFLDDVDNLKAYPSNHDRNWQSPNVHQSADMDSKVAGTRVSYQGTNEPMVVDTTTLPRLNLGTVDVSLILIRRVDGRVCCRYLTNGPTAIDSTYSMSKFMAVAAAASRLRQQTAGKCGLTATTEFHGSSIPLGDLVTEIHNYDDIYLESNRLATYFLRIATRDESRNLIRKWLGKPSEDLGTNFGGTSPEALDFTFKNEVGESVTVTPGDPYGPNYTNRMSTLTAAEFLKRLVLHREDAAHALPHVQWSDVETLFYGASNSVWYNDDSRLHGMCADTAIYVQAATDIQQIERNSQGMWRIFSKLGYDGTREFVHCAYACFPVYDGGKVLLDRGKELVICCRLYRDGKEGDLQMAQTYHSIISKVLDGTLA